SEPSTSSMEARWNRLQEANDSSARLIVGSARWASRSFQISHWLVAVSWMPALCSPIVSNTRPPTKSLSSTARYCLSSVANQTVRGLLGDVRLLPELGQRVEARGAQGEDEERADEQDQQ